MRRASLLVSGGGSLLQDGTSKKSLYYYVFIMRMAKRFGLKLMLYANGLGPLRSEQGRRACADIISKADYVSLRERASLALAGELGVTGDIRVTADPAFMLERAPDLWCRHIIARESIPERYFIVSVKDGNNFDGEGTGSDTVAVMARDICAIADKYDMEPLFVPMYPDRDTAITETLANKVGRGKVIGGLRASELCGLLRGAQLAIGTRLHMLIFAASECVPMLGISYDPKIDAFLEYIGEKAALDIRTLSEGQLLHAADELLSESELIKSRLNDTCKKLRVLAEGDCNAVTACFFGESAF